jgi:hypothetical protein
MCNRQDLTLHSGRPPWSWLSDDPEHTQLPVSALSGGDGGNGQSHHKATTRQLGLLPNGRPSRYCGVDDAYLPILYMPLKVFKAGAFSKDQAGHLIP